MCWPSRSFEKEDLYAEMCKVKKHLACTLMEPVHLLSGSSFPRVVLLYPKMLDLDSRQSTAGDTQIEFQVNKMNRCWKCPNYSRVGKGFWRKAFSIQTVLARPFISQEPVERVEV